MTSENELVRSPRRLMDRFDLELPDLFRWWEDRAQGLLPDGRIRVEEEVKDGVLHVRAEAPGIDPDEDAEISVSDGMLRIRVERRQEERTESEGTFRTEFRYGSFTRAFPLPKGVTADDVSASYKDGILDIAVPLPAGEATPPRTISVNRA